MQGRERKTGYEDLEREVISKGLCTRCGVCGGVCPVEVIGLDDNEFPVLDGQCTACGLCVKVCPGADVDYPFLSGSIFGSVYEPQTLEGYAERTFVGHAADPLIRNSGASGGLVTGLLTYLLDRGEIDGAIVVRMDTEDPLRSKGILATTKEQLLQSARSKYCITPAMRALGSIRNEKGRFAVVGLPCQVHGLRKLAAADPKLSDKIEYILGLYCHLSLTPNAHREAILASGIDISDVAAFNFRGGKWPGGFQVIKKNRSEVILNKIQIRLFMNFMFRLYGCQRCSLCIDTLCEYADLSFGDFWSQDFSGFYQSLTQSTLVSQRTEKGAQLLERAKRDKAIFLYELSGEHRSKRIINTARVKKKRAFVKLNRLKMKGQPYPDYHFPLPRQSEIGGYPVYLIHRFWEWMRRPFLRKIILKTSLSKFSLILEKINIQKQRFFCNYHDGSHSARK